MKKYKIISGALQQIYTEKKYYLLSLGMSLFIFTFHSLLYNYNLLIHDFSLKLLFLLFLGTATARTITSLIFLIILSVLGGIVFSAAVYVLHMQISSGVKTGVLGIFMSIIAPACSSCALGILGLLGLGGVLLALPFKGQELNIAAMIILLFSLVSLSKRIVAKTCTLPK